MGHGVKLLLDTCTFVWLTQEPHKLTSAAKRAVDNAGNELFLSHASIWEIHLKSSAGKLQLPDSPRSWISQQLAARGVADWAIDLESLHETSELPPIHKDPFDRLLIAQAQVHHLHIVSPDEFFSQYRANVIW